MQTITSVTTIEKNGADGYYGAEPVPWVVFEFTCAQRTLANLEVQFKSIKKKMTKKRVHNTRVGLRRWFAVWNTMREDGWENKKFQPRIGDPLNNLLNSLGAVRDIDVLIELSKSLSCRNPFIKALKRKRRNLARELQIETAGSDLTKLLDRLHIFLQRRRRKMEAEARGSKLANELGTDHIQRYLVAQEQEVKLLEKQVADAESMHRLRLSIKRWRYLLSEFYGIKNADLEHAQDLLGKIRDLDRIKELLIDDGRNASALANAGFERTRLMEEFSGLKHRLPYGLTPTAHFA